ncbi:aspartyl-phosphate phosphatase Spo0E family protein [Desulfotruncus alcoholivorax]|uniref:aspartyl-phosphate phosphatase Spo0E family protein n=1 Tax=Desulfotruncus alcoholivorax TaxID=265477 RepID=UPI0004079AAA
MKNVSEALEKVEELRSELCKLCGSYTSQEALRISQELDYYIVAAQKMLAFDQGTSN